jgi:hypothetical protein
MVPPAFLETEQYRQQADVGEFDVVIYDRCAPTDMPQASTLFIGTLPPGDDWKAGGRQEGPAIVDSDRAHPMMQLIEMGNVRIASGFPVTPPSGGRSLVDGDLGSLLAIAPRGSFEDAVLGFEILGEVEGRTEANTDWPIRRSYPMFFMNALRHLGGARTVLSLASVSPGQPVILQAESAVPRLRIESPSGEWNEVIREAGESFVFTRTDELGVYQVREGESDRITQRFAVNLFDARESNLVPEPEIRLEHESIAARASVEPLRAEMWKGILLLVIGLLLFEWYIYNRRVYL